MARVSRLTPAYSYDESSGRYRAKLTGRFISAGQVRAALDAAIVSAGRDVTRITQALREGRVTLAAWQTTMEGAISSAHVASAALARGGWAQMSQADFGRVGQVIRQQFGYLARWVADVAAGRVPLDGRMLARASLYIEAARTAYHLAEQREMVKRGMLECRRTLHATESCPDCVGYAARGWQPIGELPMPGQESVCRSRCRCTVEYQGAA